MYLRDIAETDKSDEIRALFKEYFRELGQSEFSNYIENDFEDWPLKFLGDKGRLILCIDEGQLVGCAGLRVTKPQQECELIRYYVRPSARRKGIGIALVSAVIRAAQQNGYVSMFADTLPALNAFGIYERLGFVAQAFKDRKPHPEAIHYVRDLRS